MDSFRNFSFPFFVVGNAVVLSYYYLFCCNFASYIVEIGLILFRLHIPKLCLKTNQSVCAFGYNSTCRPNQTTGKSFFSFVFALQTEF